MSSDYYRRQIQQIHREIARLQRDKGTEAGRVASALHDANAATQAANKSRSTTTAASKMRDAQRFHNQAAGCQKRIADLEGRIARGQTRLADAEKGLSRAQADDSRRHQWADEARARKQEKHIEKIDGALARHDTLHRRALLAIERLERLPERIVVLMLAANPLDQEQLRLDEEARSIGEMIRKSKHRDAIRLETCWAVRPLDVLQAINEYKPAIIHFSGHGSSNDEIIFQNDRGEAKPVSKQAIVETMAAASGDIQLVFFNTCYSQSQANALVEHVDAAIGMKDSVSDEAARVFAAAFYSAVGFGLSVRRAFDQAKAALMLEDIPEEDIPELFVGDGLDADQLVLVRPPDATSPDGIGM